MITLASIARDLIERDEGLTNSHNYMICVNKGNYS